MSFSRNRPPGPNESSVAIQTAIEGFTSPRQLVARDALVDRGVPRDIATEVVRGIGVYANIKVAKEKFAKHLQEQGFKDADALAEVMSQVTDTALNEVAKEHGLDLHGLPSSENLNKVIDLCAAGQSWDDACKQVGS